jgi:hypothetical protein
MNKVYDLAQPAPKTHAQHFPCLSVSIQLINVDIPPKPGAVRKAVSWRYFRNMQLWKLMKNTGFQLIMDIFPSSEILNLKKGGRNYENKIIIGRCCSFMSDTLAGYGSSRRLVAERFD